MGGAGAVATDVAATGNPENKDISSGNSAKGGPFFAAILQAMDSADNDYLALYALCLIYSIQQNKGIKFAPSF